MNDLPLFLFRIGLSCINAAKEINCRAIERIQDITDLIGLLAIPLHPRQVLLPVLLCSLFQQILDAHILIVDGIQVALIAMALNIHDVRTDAEDFQDLLAIVLGRISKAALNVIGIRKTAARNKSGILGRMLAALGEPLKVVGIVDMTGLDGLAGVPGEWLMAARAEHLVASIDLGDHFSARRAGLRVLANELGRCQCIG